MATGIYVGNSTAKKVKGIYIGVSNISKKLKRAYIGIGGLSKLWWTNIPKVAFSRLIYTWGGASLQSKAASLYPSGYGNLPSYACCAPFNCIINGRTYSTAKALFVNKADVVSDITLGYSYGSSSDVTRTSIGNTQNRLILTGVGFDNMSSAGNTNIFIVSDNLTFYTVEANTKGFLDSDSTTGVYDGDVAAFSDRVIVNGGLHTWGSGSITNSDTIILIYDYGVVNTYRASTITGSSYGGAIKFSNHILANNSYANDSGIIYDGKLITKDLVASGTVYNYHSTNSGRIDSINGVAISANLNDDYYASIIRESGVVQKIAKNGYFSEHAFPYNGYYTTIDQHGGGVYRYSVVTPAGMWVYNDEKSGAAGGNLRYATLFNGNIYTCKDSVSVNSYYSGLNVEKYSL